MAIKFKTQSRRNPQVLTAPYKFYAAAIGNGETDMEALASMISYKSTLTDTDCFAVLRSLEHNIIIELNQGRIVKLGNLGNFQVSLSSEGKSTAEDVTSTDVKKSRILFRPRKKLRNILKSVNYQKVS